MNKVIILGNDHTNSLGVAQSLGISGYDVDAYVWGKKTGLLKMSNFVKNIYSAKDVQDCIDQIAHSNSQNDKIPIIASCDTAAIALDNNRTLLKDFFLFEYAINYSLEEISVKNVQVELALRSGFNVPQSRVLSDMFSIPEDLSFPCIIKPLVSCLGAKKDIRVCRNIEELKNNLKSLNCTKQVLLQQYIERDYEISILGVGLKNGEVIIPSVENKLTLYPPNVGLECFVNMQPLKDQVIVNSINNLIKEIGYVGPFSVEMMHSRDEDKFYFTEINLRNDGAQGFFYKYGVNLPLNHVEDLLNLPISKSESFNPGYYIWEMHHTLSLVHGKMSLRKWLNEMKMSRGFLTYLPSDKKPFLKQYINWFLVKLRLKKYELYK